MLYLTNASIEAIGINWQNTIAIIEKTIGCLYKKDYAQIIKSYLRYKDLKNRIIAMPAFVGEDINTAGIKWIASFPDNINHNLSRAHCVIILNNSENGIPFAVINSSLLSIIRTASVSGLLIKYYDKIKNKGTYNIGIIGFGPIGQNHLKMCCDLLESKINTIYLYDLRKIPFNLCDNKYQNNIKITDSWQQVYHNSDIFITCTVAKDRYINDKPIKGSILLNVSLRDFNINIYDYVDCFVVDDWDEVCRENTDIEKMHLEKGLQKHDVVSLANFIYKEEYKKVTGKHTIMFNPMGMGVFDIAISEYYYRTAKEQGLGIDLPDY